MISKATSDVIKALNDAGFEAFLVGGAVRDGLRGVSSDDRDITTNALPEQTMAVFAGHRVIPTGLQHGTVTVGFENELFEITTYRTDGSYTDGRHPDHVQFTRSLEEDLARRDFTVNALAFHPDRGIIDPFGGVDDLNRRQLRCVGNPINRFSEDALRIARLLRFASVLAFDIDPSTADAADRLCDRLELVAPERKRVELVKMLTGRRFTDVALALPRPFCRLVPALTPLVGFEQHNPHHDFTVYEHTVRAVGNAPYDTITRLALLFHDVGKPPTFSFDENGIGHFYGHAGVSEQIAKEAMTSLRFDNATIHAVLPLIHYHDGLLFADKKQLRRRLRQLDGRDNVERLLDVKYSDVSAQKHDSIPPDFREIRRLLDDIIRDNDCVHPHSLAVNGHDLINAGFTPGPAIGVMLETLLDEVINERVDNTKEALMQLIESRWQP